MLTQPGAIRAGLRLRVVFCCHGWRSMRLASNNMQPEKNAPRMAKFGKRMATSDGKLARYMRQVIVYKSYPEYFPNRSAVPAKLQDALQIVENAGSFSHFENPKAEVFQDFQKKVGAQVAKLAVFNTTITLMSFAFFGVVYFAWSKKSADQQDVASNAQSSGQEQQYQITKQNYEFKPREERPNPSFQDAWRRDCHSTGLQYFFDITPFTIQVILI
jgi:hypothetical protein